jgi:hypothetical protein
VVSEHERVAALGPFASLNAHSRRIGSHAVRVLLVVLVLASLAAGCGGSSDDEDGSAASGEEGCTQMAAPDPRDPGSHEAPAGPLEDGKTYTLTFDTNCGSFTVTLDPDLAPNTAASLVALARDGYFDDTVFHRIVPGFVVQGGDPSQTGSGGPGYSTVDAPPSDATYTKGTLAMAKTAAEAPGTAGSSSWSRRRTPACRRSTRSSARSRRGWRSWS